MPDRSSTCCAGSTIASSGHAGSCPAWKDVYPDGGLACWHNGRRHPWEPGESCPPTFVGRAAASPEGGEGR